MNQAEELKAVKPAKPVSEVWNFYIGIRYRCIMVLG